MPSEGVINRRGMLLGLAGAAVPGVAGAQVPPLSPPLVPPAVPPQVAPQIIPPAPVAPAPPHPPTAPPGIDKTKIYYLFFDQAIDLNSMRNLRRQLANLAEAGVTQVVLVINSTGGQVLETLVTYSFIRALPLQVQTHAQGVVASAATILFLAGQDRSADRAARFLFHPAQTALLGLMTEQQLQDQAAQFESVAAAVNQIYADRTTLTPDQVAQFGRGQVIYTAEQAEAAGIVQTVTDLKLPGQQTARMVFLE